MTTTPLVNIDPDDPASVLPVVLGMAKLAVPNDPRRWPGAALDGLGDAIEALEAAMAVVTQRLAFAEPASLDEWRAEGARRRATPVVACACDLWPLDATDAVVDDGVVAHSAEACVNGGTIIARARALVEATSSHDHGSNG